MKPHLGWAVLEAPNLEHVSSQWWTLRALTHFEKCLRKPGQSPAIFTRILHVFMKTILYFVTLWGTG